MNALQTVRQPIIIGLVVGVVAISPTAIELCSFDPSMPHIHAETHAVASEGSLTYVVSATTASTIALSLTS